MKGKTFLHTIIDWLIEKKSEYLVDVWNILTEHVGNYATKEVLVLPIKNHRVKFLILISCTTTM